MSYKFGSESERQLATVDTGLVLVAREVIKVYDHSIIKGHRNREEQNAAFAGGYSKLQWPHGNHNALPSLALDAAPYHKRYGKLIGTVEQIKAIALAEFEDASKLSLLRAEHMIREHYCQLAGFYLGTAHILGIPLRWGGDWDDDRDLFDQSFDDLGHFERRKL